MSPSIFIILCKQNLKHFWHCSVLHIYRKLQCIYYEAPANKSGNKFLIVINICVSQLRMFFLNSQSNFFPVVSQSYNANVMDESVLKGNTAIFKCHIPSFVSDYVSVVSWLQDDNNEIATKDDRYGAFYSLLICYKSRVVNVFSAIFFQIKKMIRIKGYWNSSPV